MSIISPAGQLPTPISVASPVTNSQNPVPDRQQVVAHIEQVRLLILGMEQRLQLREDKLVKTVERAEGEGRRFEQLQKEASGVESTPQ